jgi:DNA-binding beta-propeller fold protein YncE
MLKQVLWIFALLGAFVLAGCGGNGDTTSQTTFNNGSGDQPFKPTTHLSHRSLVSNYYASVLSVMDTTQDRLTTYTFPVGTEPTYLQPSPDGSLTLVNNKGSNTISSLNNNLEAVKATINLGGWTESFVTSVSNKVGFAAVYNYSNGNPPNLPGAINRFNPTDGSLNTAIPFPFVQYLAMDPAEKHLLVFTKDDTSSPNGDDNAYWVDLTTDDPVTGVPAVSVLALPAGTLSSPVGAFFSSDGTKAYILSCGVECGGSGGAIVTEIDAMSYNISNQATNYLPNIHQGAATVVTQWAVNGARIGLIDLTANKLYVAGSTGASLTDSGGNTVQDGWFTVIDLTALTAGSPIRTGNGVKRWIRNINGAFWVASMGCGVQSCVSIVNPPTSPAFLLDLPKGDATGISLSGNSGEVYTIEGGQLFIYNQSGQPLTSQYNTDIKGQGSDVLYID